MARQRTDLVWPTIFMDDLSAEVRLLQASVRLEGYSEAPICGSVTLIGLWDERPMSCRFISEYSDTSLHLNATVSLVEPPRVEIMDMAQNVAATILVGKPVSADCQWGLLGYSLTVSLVPLVEHVHVSHDQKDDMVKTVTANLLNVPPYKGSVIKASSGHDSTEVPARLRFTGEGWRITIDDLLLWASQHPPTRSPPQGKTPTRSCGEIVIKRWIKCNTQVEHWLPTASALNAKMGRLSAWTEHQ